MHHPHQAWRGQHGDERADATRPQQKARRLDWISQQILHEWCNQRHCAEQHHTDDQHEDAAADETSVFEHLEPHE